MTDFRKMAKNFILSEGERREPSLRSYLQALEESLAKLSPRSQTDVRRLEIMREQIRGIKRHFRRLEEENNSLKEQLRVLEENKE